MANNAARPPKIYRRSLLLERRIIAKPSRHPFLRNCADDDFVASYLVYDTMSALHKRRFCYFALRAHQGFRASPARSESFEDKYDAIQYLLELNDLTTVTNKWHECRSFLGQDELEGLTRPGQLFAQLLLEQVESSHHGFMMTLFYGSEIPQLLRFGLIHHLQYHHGLLEVAQLPVGMDANEPSLMQHDQDYEACIKLAALILSLEHISKPSVWRRLFPTR